MNNTFNQSTKVWTIDVGKMSKKDAEKYMKKLIQMYKRKNESINLSCIKI
jgi:hypothetical protein